MKKIFFPFALFILIQHTVDAQTYYPKGDPKKLQLELEVPLWLPWISGQAGVDGMIKDAEGEINASPADLVKNLKGAIMLNADISRGSVVGFVNYMHINVGTEKAVAQIIQGGTATWRAKVKNDVLDIAAGGRIHFNKVVFDPFLGVRYFNLNTTLDIKDDNSAKTSSKTVSFWDPMVGARLFYYPKDRVMLFLRTDFGGISGGSSKFSWNIEGKAGYAISPTINLAGGFRTWSFKYAQYTNNARIFYMNPHFYGFELSASFMIPKRASDPKVFPKKK